MSAIIDFEAEYYNLKKFIDSEYEVIGSEIGTGMFSKVTVEIKDGKMIALKRIERDDLFERELEIYKSLDLIENYHPNMTRLYSYSKEDNSLYFEYGNYGPLSKVIHRGEFSIKWTLDIIRAIDYIHKKDIIHSDIKINNIVVMKDVMTTAKLIDFGGSFKEGEKINIITSTPCYEAIEYERTKMSDIYNYGMVLLQMLTGRVDLFNKHADEFISFSRKKQRSLIINVRSDDAISVLLEILNGCLCKSPESRPTANEILRKLYPYNVSFEACLVCGLNYDHFEMVPLSCPDNHIYCYDCASSVNRTYCSVRGCYNDIDYNMPLFFEKTKERFESMDKDILREKLIMMHDKLIDIVTKATFRMNAMTYTDVNPENSYKDEVYTSDCKLLPKNFSYTKNAVRSFLIINNNLIPIHSDIFYVTKNDECYIREVANIDENVPDNKCFMSFKSNDIEKTYEIEYKPKIETNSVTWIMKIDVDIKMSVGDIIEYNFTYGETTNRIVFQICEDLTKDLIRDLKTVAQDKHNKKFGIVSTICFVLAIKYNTDYRTIESMLYCLVNNNRLVHKANDIVDTFNLMKEMVSYYVENNEYEEDWINWLDFEIEEGRELEMDRLISFVEENDGIFIIKNEDELISFAKEGDNVLVFDPIPRNLSDIKLDGEARMLAVHRNGGTFVEISLKTLINFIGIIIMKDVTIYTI